LKWDKTTIKSPIAGFRKKDRAGASKKLVLGDHVGILGGDS
jgi:hypothetical protein